jgi:membrane associated rhomboid family serine protease
MAFRSNSPIMLALPPFRGVTRRIILIAVGAFFAFAIMGLYSGDLAGTTANLFWLRPLTALHREIWEFLTYPFAGLGLLSVLFALLSFWFFGSALEDERGSRWLSEYFLVSTVLGGLAASLLSVATRNRIPGLGAEVSVTSGMWPAVLALVVAFAVLHADQELNFNFLFKIKAKYLAAIYVLFYLATAMVGTGRFGALVALCNAGAGYGFLRWAPRRGLRVALSERWFAMRNSYYRAKRRRAAKKFTVYMRKQGKDVSLDADGRYVDPDGNKRDLKDRRWMN